VDAPGEIRRANPERSLINYESSYWLSKAIDTGATFVNIAAGDDSNQGHAQTATNVTADLRGLGSLHQSHALLTRLTYAVPFRHWLSRQWRVSSIFVAKSGIPFRLVTGSDGPGFGNVDGVTGDRPKLLDPSILGRTIAQPDVAAALLPRSAFAFLCPTHRRGNLGSNAFFRAGYIGA